VGDKAKYKAFHVPCIQYSIFPVLRMFSVAEVLMQCV